MSNIAKGRNLAFAAICIVLGISALSIILNLVLAENNGITAQLIRFVLECLLCYFVYSGKVWAKWVMVVMLGIASVLWFFVSIVSLSNLLSGLRALLNSAAYLSVVLILLVPKSVREYFNSLRLKTY